MAIWTALHTIMAFIAATPIDVRRVPPIEVVDSRWAIFAAWMSAAVAIATGVLAWFTYRLAKRTLESVTTTRLAMDDEERRHKDGFMPHLAFEVTEEDEDWESSEFVRVSARWIRLKARNIGAGFAQDISTELRRVPSPEVVIAASPLALGVGQVILLASQLADSPERFGDYGLTYRDAFGRAFASRITGDITPRSRYTWHRMEELDRT